MADTTQAKEFRLKDGVCQVFPDRLVIVQHKNLQIKSDHHLLRILLRSLLYGFIFMIIGTILFAFTFAEFQQTVFPSPKFIFLALFTAISVIIAFLIMLAIASNLINATAGTIDRDQITFIKFKPGIPLFINPHFLVKFKSDSGKNKKRLLILPTPNKQNGSDIANAIIIMRQEMLV